MGIGAVNNDAQWHWINENLGQYNPLCEHLEKEFAVEFTIDGTGGGCYALVGHLPTGQQVMITMADDVLTTYAEHATLEADGDQPGWAVGIYTPADDYSETTGWSADRSVSIDDFPGVARLVREALANADAQTNPDRATKNASGGAVDTH